MRNRTRRAERGQNPPRRTRTEPAPATTPSSRPHASVQCSAQRTRLRASRAYLVRSPRKYTELRSRVGEVASSSPRGPLRGRAEREQNPTFHAQNANRTRRSTRVAPASARPGSVCRHTFAGFAAASNPEALACAASGAAARATVIQPPAPTRARARPCPTRRRAKSWLPLRRLAGVR